MIWYVYEFARRVCKRENKVKILRIVTAHCKVSLPLIWIETKVYIWDDGKWLHTAQCCCENDKTRLKCVLLDHSVSMMWIACALSSIFNVERKRILSISPSLQLQNILMLSNVYYSTHALFISSAVATTVTQQPQQQQLDNRRQAAMNECHK